jgi:hypothetical protein
MTAGVEGRPLDVERGWVRMLKPGERITLECTITATNDKKQLDRLLKLNG